MGPNLHLWLLLRKTVTLGSELEVTMGPRPHLWFFNIQNSDFSTRIASLYGSQPSSVVLFMHNRNIIDQNYRVSIGPRLHLSLSACEISVTLATELPDSMGTRPSPVAFECKTATSELQVSMGPRPHLWFFAFKTATLASRITSLCGSQPSSVDFVHSKQRLYAPELKSLYGSQPSSVVICTLRQRRHYAPELIVSMGPIPYISFFAFEIQRLISIRIASLYGSQPSSVDLCMQNKAYYHKNWIVSMRSHPSPVVLYMHNSVIMHQN